MVSLDRKAAFSGTKEVAEALAFDAGRLQHYLQTNLPGFDGPVSVRQFKGGQSNPTYLLQAPGRSYVLRRKPPGRLLSSAHAVDRESRVMRALHAHDFPVPAPLLFCPDDDVVGTPFFIMAHVEGRVFWDPHLRDAMPSDRAAIYDQGNATLARLHK